MVFDAHLIKGCKGHKETFDNLKIVYTKENQTADNYIERFVYKLAASHRIRVVTSDYLEQTIVLSNGGIRITPRELRDEVNLTGKSLKACIDKDAKSSTNSIFANIKPQQLEILDKIRKGKF